MTAIVPMRPEIYASFVEESVAGYARDNVDSLRWPVADALERARREFDRLLPQGLATPDHHLFEVVEQPGGATVGCLWYAVGDWFGSRSVFLYNIRIAPAFRGRGHARAAMALLEGEAAAIGAPAIGLHVFGFNATAQALYRALGYGITGFNMIKRLAADDGAAAPAGQG